MVRGDGERETLFLALGSECGRLLRSLHTYLWPNTQIVRQIVIVLRIRFRLENS